MKALGISAKLKAPVWTAFRRHCHRFLVIGYQEALQRIRNEPDEETDITGYICEALRAWFVKNPQDASCFDVHDDPPLGGSGKTGKRRPRTDIIIIFAVGARPEFYIEAKRLHRQKARASGYIGQDGMGCFISGRYAGNLVEAAMLGYVQTDDLQRWQGELKQRVNSDANTLHLTNIEPEVSFEHALPLEWASSHRRRSKGKIRIFHLLLDCRKN